jgi:hypothetical protein
MSDAHTPADSRPTLTEGARLLVARPESAAAVGAAVGACRTSVHRWRTGDRLPTPAARRKLEELYSIPVRSWTSRASGMAAAPPVAPVGAGDGASPLEELRGLLATVQEAQRAPGLTPVATAKLSAEARQLLVAIAKVEALEAMHREPAEAADVEAVSRWWATSLRMVFLALENHPWHPSDGMHPHAVAVNALCKPGEFPAAAAERLVRFGDLDRAALDELVALVRYVRQEAA